MGDRVLVTGAGGFIGSHLAEALAVRGDDVCALVHYHARGDIGNLEFVPESIRARLTIVRGDIADPVFVRRAVTGCKRVYHLAALVAIPYSYEAARHVFDVNTLGTLHVAQACLDASATLVHTSTSEVYGTAKTVPITEAHPLNAQSPYAASKIAADQCVLSFHRSFGLRATVLRPFNTYGPRQSARAVIPAIIAQALARDAVHLGSLHPTRDLNFVGDTVRGFLAAGDRIESVAGEVVQLGTGREISVGDLARAIFRLLGSDRRIETEASRVRPGASEVERLVADASRARERLGWSPDVSLEDGLAQTIEFVRAHPDLYRPDEYAR